MSCLKKQPNRALRGKYKTIEECKKSYKSRLEAFKRLHPFVEAFIPSDRHDPGDIAFGVTKSGLFLDSSKVVDEQGKPIPPGNVSHGALLYIAGLSKTPDDPNPADDYQARGIVKKQLNGKVIFWENHHELFRHANGVKTAIQKLLDAKFIDGMTEIYGVHEEVPVALASEIAHW